MITAIQGPLIYQPEQWVLVFDRKPLNWWLGWLVWGKYKHVRAYGYVPFLHVWLFYDATFAGIEMWVAADGEPARAMIGKWIAGDTTLVLMPRRAHANRSTFTAMSGWCVPAVKRLIGLRSSALRASSLFADCMRPENGGRLYGLPLLTRPSTAAASASSGICAAARSGGPAAAPTAASPPCGGSSGATPGLRPAAS